MRSSHARALRKEKLKIKMASPHTGGAHGFSQQTLERKLQHLNSSLQNIQAVAQWAIYYRRHAKTVVSVWYKELQKADAGHKLTLLYLANDIVQNSRKKGSEYKAEFSRVLPRAFHVVSKEKDQAFQQSVSRVISVWEERNIFEIDALTRFKASLVSSSLNSRRTRSESDIKRPPLAPSKPKKQRGSTSSDSPKTVSTPDDKPPNNRDPPESDELLRRMLVIDGDKSTCNDNAVREKIAGFPPEIQDHELLSKVKDKAGADQLEVRLGEAEKVLSEYVERLEAEEKERKDLQELLEAFMWQHRQQLKDAKKKLKHYQTKLERVTGVKEELALKLARLPDLSQLPTSSHGSLAPLPSVGDLFN